MAKLSARQITAYRMELTAWFGASIFLVGLVAQIATTATSYVFFLQWLKTLPNTPYYLQTDIFSWFFPLIVSFVPPIVAYVVGEKIAKPRAKYEHMYNGVLFVFLSIWLNVAFITAFPIPVETLGPVIYTQYLPSVISLVIVLAVAFEYGKKYKKQPLHEFAPYQFLLIGLMAAVFIAGAWAYISSFQGEYIELVAMGIMGILISIGMVAVPYVFSNEKNRITRLTHACIAGSIGIWSFGAAATIPLYAAKLQDIQAILPTVIGLAAWFVYIYLLHRHNA